MDPVLVRLDRWLRRHRPRYYAGLAPGAAPERVDELARRVGGEAPPLLRQMYQWRDGQTIDCPSGLVFGLPWMSTAEIVDVLDFFNDLGFPLPGRAPRRAWRAGWLPILADGAGDYLCVDLLGAFRGRPGQIVQFWHDDRPSIDFPSFDAWLGTLVEAMEAGLFGDGDGDSSPRDDCEYDEFVRARNPGYPITP